MSHEFVDLVPGDLKQGTLYISILYATVVHLCACGCGIKVVTPISPPEWKLIWDGDTVSLDPSIGNWQFPCRSHYWIRRNRVIWVRTMSDEQIAQGRRREAQDRAAYFGDTSSNMPGDIAKPHERRRESMTRRLRRLLRLRFRDGEV